MGKASRLKEQTAREKIAAQRAAAKRAQARRRVLITAGSMVAVLAVVGALIGIKLAGSGGGPGSGGATTSQLTGSQLTAVVNRVTSVPPATLATVGKGMSFPKIMIPVTGSPLTSNGKPEVLYMGAEYCPFCATERWAMAVALSRFGTFSGLGVIHSAADDTPASIPTLTFYKSAYTSKYLTFTPVELQKVDRSPLQKPTAGQNALMSKYDAPPYVQAANAGSIPFVDFGNRWIISGASYSYQVLQGRSWSQVADALHNPSTPIAQGADGAANVMTAAICKLTNDRPASVCGTSLIKNLQGQL
jgi:thiol-disulfide isomerase/thioredoxin